jgi:subtilase family serine protease
MEHTSSIGFAVLLIIVLASAVAFPAGAVVASGPDLIPVSVSGPASAAAGKSITLSSTVTNAGTQSAGYSYLYLYLSSDSTITSGDIYLGRVYVSSLSPGALKAVSASVIIPSSVAPGTYGFGAIADGSFRVAESDEENNGIASAGQVLISGSPRPDLVVTGVSAPSSAAPGSKIAITPTVKNTGDASASYSYVYFYLSPDSIRDAGDTYLGKLYISSLSPGYSKTASYSATIPQGIPGTYYVCARADGSGRVAEKDEGNNDGYSSAVSIQAATTPAPTPSLKPDLVAVSVDGPSAGTRGETLTVEITVRNGGTAFSGSTSSAMYLSSDTTITPADIFLGSRSVPGISAGSSVSLTGTAMVPSSVPAGSYYIGAIIDSTNTISEIDEGNNIAWDPSTVAITVPVPGS